MGGRIVGAVILGVTQNSVMVQELHSTKGWKFPYLTRRKNMPGVQRHHIGFFSRTPSGRGLPAEAGRHMRGRTLMTLNKPPDLMRHSWYRRQQREKANAA